MCRESAARQRLIPHATTFAALFAIVAAATANADIVNPSFEIGLTGWSSTGFTSVTGTATPTDQSYYATALVGPTIPGSGLLSQTFTLPASAQTIYVDMYLLAMQGTADAKLILPGNINVILWQQPGSTNVDGHFRRYHYDVSNYAGQAVTLEFSVVALINQSAQVDVDRIVIESIPEPATLLLLACGAILCSGRKLRRRHK